jgi:hypothetical protein
MGGFGAAVMLVLAGWAALSPAAMSWVYIGALIAFELWLARRMAAAGSAPVAVGEPPYHFTAEEAGLVGRYRFYFTYPRAAREAAPVLAALGLSALLLAPWLTYKHAFVQALLIGVNLFAVARFTKAVAPLMALRIAASKGERAALRMLESHDPAWSKIRSSKEVSE